jgi:hypothetical protein
MNSGHIVNGGMAPGAPAHATTIASLVGLPNELLHEIFTYLSNQYLFTLAAVCHRLHTVALSIYFSAHGIDPEALLSSPTLVLTGKQIAALPGLLRRVVRPRVKSIRFVWYGSLRRPEYVSVYEVLLMARCQWIEVLDGLEEIDLDFNGVSFGDLVYIDCAGPPWQPTASFETRDDVIMVLLRAVACSSCQRLYIRDTPSNCWPNPIPRSSPPAIFHVPRTFKNIRQSFYTLLRPRGAGRQDGTRRLQSLSLDCSFLFKSSHLIEWTISTLSRSSATLTTLSIVSHDISTECFAVTLPLLHLPLLSNLSISASSLLFSDLVKFLRRHPAITMLKFSRGILCHNDTAAPSWNLPRLRTLCATPDYVDHLLRGRRRSWFPELGSIWIEPTIHDSSGAQSTEKALWAVSEFLGTWGAKARRLSLSITIDPGNQGYLNLSTSSDTWPHPRPEQRLHRVDTLHLVTKPETPLCPNTIIHWLRLFPALKHISFTRTCLPPMDGTERAEYVQQASEACPHLQTVQIDSVKVTVREWLKGLSL